MAMPAASSQRDRGSALAGFRVSACSPELLELRTGEGAVGLGRRAAAERHFGDGAQTREPRRLIARWGWRRVRVARMATSHAARRPIFHVFNHAETPCADVHAPEWDLVRRLHDHYFGINPETGSTDWADILDCAQLRRREHTNTVTYPDA
jgi:hypothetical protein